MRITIRSAIVFGGALALASCAGKPRLGGAPELAVLPGSELPAPGRSDAANIGSAYYLGPLDRVVIDVFGIEELSNREVQVDASGRLAFPLIGAVEAIGKTPTEIEAEMTRRLRIAHVRNPLVTLNVKETVSRVVTIEGEVRQPGAYPVTRRTTLMEAIAKAQSTTEFSKLHEVVIFRTVQGRRYAALYNLGAIRHGVYADPEIYAGDLVMVGSDNARRVFKDVLTAVPALLSPIILLVN